MPPNSKSQSSSAAPGDAGVPGCPCCRGDLLRVHRRPIDRAGSWFAPARRYRCLGFSCQWEGNILLRPNADRAPAGGRAMGGAGVRTPGSVTRISRTFVASMVLTLGGAVFIVMGTYGDWLSSADGHDLALASESTWHTSTVVVPPTQPARLP